MGDTATPGPSAAAEPPMTPAGAPPRSWGRILLAEAPYLAMLVAGFAGVAFVGGGPQPKLLYWQILAPVFGVLCVIAGWKGAGERKARTRLIWTQALHWLAFLGAMLLLFLPSVRGVVNDNATEIGLLLLLGLGTFVAGVHAGSWRIVAVGAVLGLSVPAVATMQQSALLLTMGGLVVVLVGALFVMTSARSRSLTPTG
ncbi:hypothetical protein GWK16_15490 [Roseomonas sp. JC162]|uniref:Uncharacterized protein n=1 Tax=Neoroseomonas marina TaxID=1232220 RepID=A0A848EGT2_9PROT|nr:hypothetical protein [Neoroseomonas marina]NMJ42650.1 hypothetical protein [Neoroseomonas marina]